MGLIKEYVDRAVQTSPSPYADPAVVLAAPLVSRFGLARTSQNSLAEISPVMSDSASVVLKSPISPILAPLVSRRLSRRRLARGPAGEITDRRIVSMPENKIDTSSILSCGNGKRVVSMPDRIRPVLEPSVELLQSPSTTAGDSFGSYSGRREHVRVFPAHSDVPQTPSPPSSPESLLIIASGTQLPEGFLRRKYSPEPLIEEDWIAWANSPPRPIPALHGPLSLPYARCPSGAEGTIIEEPDNVAQMIWGLGTDDQPQNQIRAEVPAFNHDQGTSLFGHSPVPSRLQKKKTSTQQALRSSRTQISLPSSHAKPIHARAQRQELDGKRGSIDQASFDAEARQDIVSGVSWNEGQSISASVGASDDLVNDSDVSPIGNNRILEWQLARLRHALRTSLVDMGLYSTYPGRLEPVIPGAAAPGFSQSYPRIFVEPRLNESVNPATGQSPIELAQQYRQLYRQTLQKQKLQQTQSILPTPPNSSSPQWSSHFSPNLTHYSTLSPELAGPAEQSTFIPSQKYRSGVNASQYLRHFYERHEHDDVNDFDTNIDIPSVAKIPPQNVPNINSTVSSRPSTSSSSTLAKYIRQLQALSPIAHFSSLQPVPQSSVASPSFPLTSESTGGPFQNVHHMSTVPTPPSPESPQALSRGSSYHNPRSMPPTRHMQRRLSSVPEEDSAPLDPSMSGSAPRLQSQVTTDCSLSSQDGTRVHQTHRLEVPLVDVARKTVISGLPESENSLGTQPIAFYEISPAKVRLPVNKDRNSQEHTNRYHEQNKGHQHGNKKKHRYKKLRGPTPADERASTTRGLVG